MGVNTYPWQPNQSHNLIVADCAKDLAAQIEVPLDTLYKWRQAVWPVPAYRAAILAEVQQSLLFFQQLLRPHGLLVMFRPTPSATRSPLILLASFASFTNQVLELIVNKINKGETLTPEEAEIAEALLDKAQNDVEALREIVRGQTRKERKQ